MAFLSGIFGNQSQQQGQQQQQQGQQGQQQNMQGQQGQQQNQPNPGGSQPASQQQQPNNSQFNGQNANPLDNFMSLLVPSEEVVNQQRQQQQQMESPLFGSVDPRQIQEQVGKTSFLAGIDPQALTTAMQNQDGNAIMQMFNKVAQNAFQASLQMSQGLVEHGVRTGQTRFDSTLDSRFRELQLRNKNSSNPALKSPAGEILLKGVRQMIAQANPRLNADEVHAKAEEYLTTFAQQAAPTPNANESQQSQEPDWMAFLNDTKSQ